MTGKTTTVTTTDPGDQVDVELAIPAPRSGQAYELYVEEVLGGWHGRHGCLDSPSC